MNLSQYIIPDEEPPDEEHCEEEEEEDVAIENFSVLYDDELKEGLAEEVVFSDEDVLRHASEVLHGTVLDEMGEEASEEVGAEPRKGPVEHQEPEPVQLYQSGRPARSKARRTYGGLARGNFPSNLSDTDNEPVGSEPEGVVLPKASKRSRRVVSAEAPEAPSAPQITIRSPKAKRARGGKKGKDPVEVDGRALEYYLCK